VANRPRRRGVSFRDDDRARPILSDWRNFETWHEDGAMTATERASRIWRQLIAEYEPPPLDPGAAEALDAFVARRRAEIEAAG
jgi:trimethylamine--corrinoid protein Co-methyltransferase